MSNKKPALAGFLMLSVSHPVALDYSASSDVQFGHLVASIAISDLQKGHTFVVSSSSLPFLLI